MRNICLLPLVLLCGYSLQAQLKLPGLFGDNMVLQRNQPIAVWGWSKPGAKITVAFDRQQKMTRAGKDGKWMVHLDPEEAGGPYELAVSGGGNIIYRNVLVGEVWLCSGQSNMEMPIAGWGKINRFEQEMAAASYPQIRHIKIPRATSTVPREDISQTASWEVCSPLTSGEFSAAAYFFAREIYNRLHVPVGLINTSWGGTMIETWISRGAFEQSKEFQTMISGLPVTGLEELHTKKKEALKHAMDALQGPRESMQPFQETSLDDSHWPIMKLPGLWEQQGTGLEELDGVVWFRKTITISAENAGKPASLFLGKIDDSDDTYLNGVLVGRTSNKYSEQRNYPLAAGLLRPGKNLIAVRVEDTGGGGGFFGDMEDMKLVIGSQQIPLAGAWSFRIDSVYDKGDQGMDPNGFPTLLFNAMIHPLIPFAIRGAIWYQGESNAGRAYQYRKAFPLMITDWRKQWAQGDFPFLFVQLASFNAAGGDSQQGSTWAELREAQSMTLSLPGTGMAVTTDIGDPLDIHPKNKQDVGKRLAAIALSTCYRQEGEYSGPVYESMEIKGNKVLLTFSHIGKGWEIKDKYGYIRGFEIAGTDHKFHYAKARLEGTQIIVYQEGIDLPVAVRYGWADNPTEANLFNLDGFPASPFRTDTFPGITEQEGYHIAQ